MVDGPNTYAYVGNNPVNWVDADGQRRFRLVPKPFPTPPPAVNVPGVPSIPGVPNIPSNPNYYNRDDADMCDADKDGFPVSPLAEDLEPPGDCDEGEQKRLQREVKDRCDNPDLPRGCGRGFAGLSSVEYRVRALNNQMCALARDRVNKKCFMGGDVNHRNQAIDAWRAQARCLRRAAKAR